MDKKNYLINILSKDDINIEDVIKLEFPNSKGYKIEDEKITWWWENNPDSKPSKTKLNSLLTALQNDWDKYQYARDRKREYPAITEQLDMIYHNMDSWKSSILAIKSKYPKEG